MKNLSLETSFLFTCEREMFSGFPEKTRKLSYARSLETYLVIGGFFRERERETDAERSDTHILYENNEFPSTDFPKPFVSKRNVKFMKNTCTYISYLSVK